MKYTTLIFPFVVLLALLIALESLATALSLAVAMIIHELGHIGAILFFGGSVMQSELYGIGANINYNVSRLSTIKEIIIYAAGPIAGFIASAAGNLLNLKLLTHFSLSLTIINLIPALPLDGGNILKLLLPSNKSDILITTISLVIGVLMIISGVYAIIVTGNFSVLVLGICILVSIISKKTLQ